MSRLLSAIASAIAPRALTLACALALVVGCGEGAGVSNTPDRSGGALCIGPASTHSEGCAPLAWPAGPEDLIAGVEEDAAKFKTCGALWTCANTACKANSGPDCLTPCLDKGSTEAV
ncbi:MAG: hypothetical protein KC502_14825 [Myxococcales bacterium]|nr:hypothetical protein [Myxococcales bacterium]